MPKRRPRHPSPAVQPSWAWVGVIAAGVALGNLVPDMVRAAVVGVLLLAQWVGLL